MPISTVKEAFPTREVEQVVDAMIDTNDSVERRLELKSAHICDVKGSSLGKFLAGSGQHSRRYIQAAHLVSGRERSNNAAGSTGNLEQGRSPAAFVFDNSVDKIGLSGGIARDSIIMPGERIVRCHAFEPIRDAEMAQSPAGGELG